MRYLLDLSYDGTNYNGWQSQSSINTTIQQQVELRLSNLLRDDISIVGAGRTDTGVHAKQMFAHFDCDQSIECQSFKKSFNNYLPKDISLRNISVVSSDFHARFSAIRRRYVYKITTVKNPFLIHKAYWFKYSLDVNLMNQAGQILLNHIDFECFSKVKTDVTNFECTLFKAECRKEEEMIVFEISANRFLRNMVRAIVGTLLEIGQRKKSLDDLKYILDSRNRSLAGPSVPACGLYLEEIEYPEPLI